MRSTSENGGGFKYLWVGELAEMALFRESCLGRPIDRKDLPVAGGGWCSVQPRYLPLLEGAITSACGRAWGRETSRTAIWTVFELFRVPLI